MNTEIAEVMQNKNMYELAAKTAAKVALDSEDKEVVSTLDAWAKEIGKKGYDKEHQIAAFIQTVIEERFAEYPNELLDMMFERGNIGEFDSYEIYGTPKNTLKAIECAKGGNVDRSFLDIPVLAPQFHNRQVESDISYIDIRRNGWKTIALLTDYAVKALENAMFADALAAVDAAITSGAANYITEATAAVTQTSADALALYLHDRAEGDCVIVALSKYIQQMSKLTGFASDDMKSEVNQYGFLGKYDGIPMWRVSGQRTYDGTNLILPDKRVFGFAGKIGVLDMRGDVHTYQSDDIDNERIHIKVADFNYGIAFNETAALDAAKIVTA